MEFVKNLEQYFDINKAVDTAEKNAISVLAYVQPKEMSETFTKLTTAGFGFARANLEAIKSVTKYVTATAEEAGKNFAKHVSK